MFQLVTHPDPRLRAQCEPVTVFGPELSELAEGMLELMYASGGVGLAAPQAGAHVRLLVADPTGDGDANGTYVMCNPRVTWRSETVSVLEEGCLSVPGRRAWVTRPEAIEAEWVATDGTKHRQRFDGNASRVIQHELDHLDGVLITDRVGPVRDGGKRGRAV